jgi:mRNA interferase MazF
VVIPAAGAVVLVRFPFSDLSQFKLRPAIILADAGRDDWILCQITSNPYGDARAIRLADASFSEGGLPLTSYVRPAKILTGNKLLMIRQVGTVKSEVVSEIVEVAVKLLRGTP